MFLHEQKLTFLGPENNSEYKTDNLLYQCSNSNQDWIVLRVWGVFTPVPSTAEPYSWDWGATHNLHLLSPPCWVDYLISASTGFIYKESNLGFWQSW